jgi:hypothetical protein
VNADATTRAWLVLVPGPPKNADASAWAEENGERVGVLAAWLQKAKPVRDALRIDPRVIDPGGDVATVSLVRAPDGVRLRFDDLAVQQARRRVLAGPPFDSVTTMLRDSSHFEGAVTVARGGRALRIGDDPFARVFPARVLEVGAGLFGVAPPPAGPTIERYGSAEPWPWDRFL